MLGSYFDLSKEIARIADARDQADRPIRIATPPDEAPVFAAERPARVDAPMRHEARAPRPGSLGFRLSQLT